MRKILIILITLWTMSCIAQTYNYPLNTSLTLLSNRNITIGAKTCVPVAIASKKNNFTPNYIERFATSWYTNDFAYGQATKVSIFNSISDFETNVNATTLSGFTGVEALAFDNIGAGNLYVMETENGGGNLRIFNGTNTEIATYSSGDIGTDLMGPGFANARGMDFDNNNNIYIADDDNNRIIKISSPSVKSSHTTTVPITLPLNSHPKSVCIKDNIIFIACYNSNLIYYYNLIDNSYIGQIATGTFSPLDLTINKSQGTVLYCSMKNGNTGIEQVVAYDLNTKLAVQTYSDFGSLSLGPWGMTNNGKGDLYCTDGSNGRIVKYSRTRLSEKNFLTFTVDNQIGASTIDVNAHTIQIAVPFGFDSSSVHTHYTLSNFATCTPNSYDYNLMTTNFTTTKSLVYTITAEDGSTQTWTVSLNPQGAPPVTLAFPNPCLIGYLHNWNDVANNLPYIQLDQVPSKYNVINYAFAHTNGNANQGHIELVLDPSVDANAATRTQTFNAKMAFIQNQGRRVLISLGGEVPTGYIQLSTIAERDEFISSLTQLLTIYPFDGVDIDMEGTCFEFDHNDNFLNPATPKLTNFIYAIKAVMANYRSLYHKKMLLTMAPERHAITGGLSCWSYFNEPQSAAYLPLIQYLKDSIDVIHTQLYGNADDIVLDGNDYNAGTIDNLLGVTEMLYKGYELNMYDNNANCNVSGSRGTYTGIPASKIVLGVAICNAASIGAVDTLTIRKVVNYLNNTDGKPASYTKISPEAIHVRGLMTWSINYEVASACGNNNLQTVYQNLFEKNMFIINANEILTFMIPNQVGNTFINTDQKTIAITVPAGTNVSALIPTLTTSTNTTSMPLSGVAQDFTNPVVYKVSSPNGSYTNWIVTVTILPSNLSSEKEILTYSLPNQVGPTSINSTSAQISINMPATADVTSVIPSFSISPFSTSNIANSIPQNYSSPIIQTITAQDGSTKNWTITVTKLASVLNSIPMNNILISPNPTSDYLHVKSDEFLQFVEIIDVFGHTIFAKKCDEKDLKIDLTAYPSGIYYLETKSINERVQHALFIKN